MRKTTTRLLLASAAMMTLVTPARASGPPILPTNFGLSSPIFAGGSSLLISYYGWENTTVYGHTLWAFTAAEYATNLAGSSCFVWAGGSCSGGTAMFTKNFGVAVNPYLDLPTPTPPLLYRLAWAAGTEVVFALQVNMNNNWLWFFSGDPTRNYDGLAHVAYFGTGGVVGDDGFGIIPGTPGLRAYGFEDVGQQDSDWDFDNAIFTIDESSPPTDVVPEPATMTLIGTGLLGLAAARKKKRLAAASDV